MTAFHMLPQACEHGDPQGTLFPTLDMNLAFERELTGSAMYFQLMGDAQPIGRYDDTGAGAARCAVVVQRRKSVCHRSPSF